LEKRGTEGRRKGEEGEGESKKSNRLWKGKGVKKGPS